MMGDDEPADRSAGQMTSVRSLHQRLAHTDAWGEIRVVRELPGGNRNPVLLVERAGERFVAKGTRRSAEAVAWLERVHAQARDVGLVVPEAMRSRAGNLVEDGVTLERFLEGRPADARSLTRLRAVLRSFHEATRQLPQRPGFASSAAMVQRRSAGDIDLDRMPPDLVEVCRAAWSRLADVPHSVVHGDLQRDNVLVTPEGDVALVDWDEARVDASILDDVALSVALGGRPRPGWEAAEAALRAWDVASCWELEPAFARRLAAELPDLRGGADLRAFG